MVFNETNNEVITLNHMPQTMIYFLLDKAEVVYVGQTTNGVGRPFQHAKDKKFDSVKIIPCPKEKLDEMESVYITKYNPKYNRILNRAAYTRLITARNELRERGCDNYTIPKLKRDAKELNIEFVSFNGNQYIKTCDIERLFAKVKGTGE